MSSVTQLRGEPVSASIRESVRERVTDLRDRGTTPTLATVLMSDDPSDERFIELKGDACESVGIDHRDVRVDAAAPVDELRREVERVSADPKVHGVFVQVPLPGHVASADVRKLVAPGKDVDCFHPENLGSLVAGDPRFVPATPAAVLTLLNAYDVETAGKDVVVVGRSDVIGKPLANRLFQRAPGGDATVTVCHSHTADLAAHTRGADVVVTACGVPELVDGSMVSPGVVVVDVSANRRPAPDGTGVEVVGDVDAASVRPVADALTPVPGGVGPVTLAMLLQNTVLAAERQA